MRKRLKKGYWKEKEEICIDTLQSVNLSEHENVLCQHLSGGMKRRLSIALAFIGNTKLVLLGLIFSFLLLL